jgi:hypothetical protein
MSGHVGFMADKVALGQVSSEYLGFFPTANSHSTDCSAFIIYHPGLVQHAKWWPTYEVDSVSPNSAPRNKRKLYIAIMKNAHYRGQPKIDRLCVFSLLASGIVF